jgi:dihydroflavonol-4-reductase
LACERVYADLSALNSLTKALKSVDVLFQVAAVFKHWSKNSQKDIIQANITITQNIIEASARNHVKKIIYVSSMAALDHTSHPMTAEGWNQDNSNPYYRAKTESEQLAFELANRYGIPIVSVLPSAIIGPNCFRALTPTMDALKAILKNQLPFDPDFTINYVYVDDVVDGMIAAMEKGKVGQRYILGNEDDSSLSEAFQVAHEHYPQVKIRGKRSRLTVS